MQTVTLKAINGFVSITGFIRLDFFSWLFRGTKYIQICKRDLEIGQTIALTLDYCISVNYLLLNL